MLMNRCLWWRAFHVYGARLIIYHHIHRAWSVMTLFCWGLAVYVITFLKRGRGWRYTAERVLFMTSKSCSKYQPNVITQYVQEAVINNIIKPQMHVEKTGFVWQTIDNQELDGTFVPTTSKIFESCQQKVALMNNNIEN